MTVPLLGFLLQGLQEHIMPNLPVISVTDAQLARIIAAFPGETTAEKEDAYRAWLMGQLRNEVLRAENLALEVQHAQAIAQNREDLDSSLFT